MGRKMADASATKRTCALVSVASYKSRFRIMPSHDMHTNCDGDRDRPVDVTTESIDVSDRRQRSEGRGLTCRRSPTVSQHGQHRQCNAVCPGSKGAPPSSLGLPSFKLQVVQVKRSCKASSRKHVDKRKEDLAGVRTWRTDRWARWKPVEAAQARESGHRSCSLRATQNCR